MMTGPMASRAGERAFARRAFGDEAPAIFGDACGSCHVTGCEDCHGQVLHTGRKPKDDACLRCHRGYFVGSDYYGRAPREDHSRYQRGATANGEMFLKMLPDVHQERGMVCADCHSMRSLQEGRPGARTCVDCHRAISPDVPAHAVRAHLEQLECAACHAAWAPQEYGTFLVRPSADEQADAFAPLPRWGSWRKSAYLKRQDAPPLGLNAQGRVAPIRPQFVLLATDAARGWDNRLLAAEWRAFAPHTIRRGTVTCDGCHGAARRFVLEANDQRIYRPDLDGLPFGSFWQRGRQSVSNGAFFPDDRYRRMTVKTPEFTRGYLRQWNTLLEHVDPSSKR
jgi:hypothetical protein